MFETNEVLSIFSLLDTVLTLQQWNKIVGGDAAETGAGPGSYDIRKSVWHVNVSTIHKSMVCVMVCVMILRKQIVL